MGISKSGRRVGVIAGHFYQFYHFYHYFFKKFFFQEYICIHIQHINVGTVSPKVVKLVGLRLTGHHWNRLPDTCMLLECSSEMHFQIW